MEYTLEQLSYPIGRYAAPETYNAADQKIWIAEIAALPRWLDAVIENMDAYQLNTAYREGGWNVTQVIHHLADVNINMYARLKLTLTEDNPVVIPFDDNKWAVMPDVYTIPANVSITILHSLHRRFVATLEAMKPEEWQRTHFHKGLQKNVSLWEMAHKVAWHGTHHFEQIRTLRQRMNW